MSFILKNERSISLILVYREFNLLPTSQVQSIFTFSNYLLQSRKSKEYIGILLISFLFFCILQRGNDELKSTMLLQIQIFLVPRTNTYYMAQDLGSSKIANEAKRQIQIILSRDSQFTSLTAKLSISNYCLFQCLQQGKTLAIA